jgi:hypothetical protein
MVRRDTASLMEAQQMLQDTSPPNDGRKMSGPQHFPPPGRELEQLLGLLTPPGALTWRALPAELPWTRPPGNGRTRPRDGQLREVLMVAGVKTAAAQWYILNGPFTEIMVASPRELDRNHGRAARAIEVAVEHDITGGGLLDLATRLDLTDHQLAVPGKQAPQPTGDPRSARRYLSKGRALLHALGVWPWTHVNDWRCTRRWWCDHEVHRQLLAWHDRAWIAAAQRLAGCARARNGAPSTGVITVDEFEACRTFRTALAELATSHA